MGEFVQTGLTKAEADEYCEQVKFDTPDAECTVEQNAQGTYDVTVVYKDVEL